MLIARLSPRIVKSHLEKNGESQVPCFRKLPLHPREEMVVRRVRLSASGFHAKVVKDKEKMNGDSSAVIFYGHALK